MADKASALYRCQSENPERAHQESQISGYQIMSKPFVCEKCGREFSIEEVGCCMDFEIVRNTCEFKKQ